MDPTLPLEPYEAMRIDDTPHKVYIYDLDAELSSSDSESDSGSRLAFLPDIEKHLRLTRIPKAVLQPDDQGMYAGKSLKDMQLVLYESSPRSLSVPEDKDSVRRAILDARTRARQEGDKVQDRIKEAQRRIRDTYTEPKKRDTLNGMGLNRIAVTRSEHVSAPAPEEPQRPSDFSSGFGPAGGFTGTVEDDDVMDLDL